MKHDYSRLPSDYKQRSRISRVVLHRVMTDWTSFYENPKEGKEEPTFTKMKAVLGAVDSQMASISYDMEEAEMALDWKYLDKHLKLVFNIPEFILRYEISNVCLPTVHCSEHGAVTFDFPFEETLDYRCLHERKRIYAGYDLGRVKPFVLTIVNRFGDRIAVYEASADLCELNRKREENIRKRKDIAKKLKTYEEFGETPPETLVAEFDRLRDDISSSGDEIAKTTGHEIALLCEHHGVSCCFGEDLSSVDEWAGCSSRWIHGKQQEWIIRLTRRVGSVHMFVNAAGTSKTCVKCGSDVSCDSKTRISRCTSEECGFSEDRDRMASWVIAKRGIDRFIKYFSKVVENRG